MGFRQMASMAQCRFCRADASTRLLGVVGRIRASLSYGYWGFPLPLAETRPLSSGRRSGPTEAINADLAIERLMHNQRKISGIHGRLSP